MDVQLIKINFSKKYFALEFIKNILNFVIDNKIN